MPLRYWQFKDFVDHRGRNVVREWLDEQAPKVKAGMNALIRELEVSERHDRPGMGQLQRECRGLYELRLKADKVQYRIIGYYPPDTNEFVMLAGAIEKDRKFEPRQICTTAFNRIGKLESGEGASHDHDFR